MGSVDSTSFVGFGVCSALVPTIQSKQRDNSAKKEAACDKTSLRTNCVLTALGLNNNNKYDKLCPNEPPTGLVSVNLVIIS